MHFFGLLSAIRDASIKTEHTEDVAVAFITMHGILFWIIEAKTDRVLTISAPLLGRFTGGSNLCEVTQSGQTDSRCNNGSV